MTFETARAWLADIAPDLKIIDQGRSTATVADAAAALEVRRRKSPRPWRFGWATGSCCS